MPVHILFRCILPNAHNCTYSSNHQLHRSETNDNLPDPGRITHTHAYSIPPQFPPDIVGWSCRGPQADCSIRKHRRNCCQRPLSWGQKVQLPSQRRRKHLCPCELFFSFIISSMLFSVVPWLSRSKGRRGGSTPKVRRKDKKNGHRESVEPACCLVQKKKSKIALVAKNQRQQQQTNNSTPLHTTAMPSYRMLALMCPIFISSFILFPWILFCFSYPEELQGVLEEAKRKECEGP